MTLNAPTQILFIISVVFAIVGLIAFFGPTIPLIGAYSFWLMTAAFAILVAACLFKGA